MKKLLGLFSVCAMLIAITISAQAVEYRMIDLGVGWGYDINNNGQVVGKYDISDYVTHAFSWQNGVLKDLGTLGGVRSEARGINDNGQVVGTSNLGNEIHAFLWQNDSAMQGLNSLGVVSNGAYAINNIGQIVGTSRISTAGNYVRHASLWQDDSSMQDLGALGTGTWSVALNINDNGQVVGTSDITENGATNGITHAFFWQNGKPMQDLGTFGGNTSRAGDINNNGQVVGGADNSLGLVHAFLWQDGSPMQDLGTFPGGEASGANGINDNGQVVGASSIVVNDVWGNKIWTYHACIWQNGSPVQDLGTLGGAYSTAFDINNNGWIVGTSQDTNGIYHAVLWQPIPVPEPSSILTLVCGIGSLGGLAFRRSKKA